MHAQGLGDAGAEAIGLDEGTDQRTDVIDAGAIDQIAQSFGAGLAGAHLKVDQMKFVAEIGVGVMQVLADAHQGLVKSQAGFHANDGEIESVRQCNADASLTVFDHALEKETRNKEAQGWDADQQGNAIDAGENDDAGQTKGRQNHTGAEVVADMARLAESSLDEPGAGAGYIGGGKRDGFAEGIEGLLDALSNLDRRLFLSHRGLAAEGTQTGSQHGAGRDGRRPEGEYHQHDRDKHDDGQNQRHGSTGMEKIFILES